MRLTTRTRLTAAATATALAGVVLTASPAAAHTTLTSSDPAKGATVAAPAEIHLNYADPVRFPGVVVRDAQGGHHESGKPSAVDNHVVEKVAGTLAPGVYTVGWRVVAEDGHPVTGEFRFTVKGGGSASAAPAAPATDQPAAQAEKKGSSAGWWWIGLVVLILALAGGGVALARRRG
ncbi:MAG: copper resistance CopC family protein [Actinoallomurus sp.]